MTYCDHRNSITTAYGKAAQWGYRDFDFDSDGDVGESDYYFVHDCLTKDGLGNYGGPGAPCPEGDETCCRSCLFRTACQQRT